MRKKKSDEYILSQVFIISSLREGSDVWEKIFGKKYQ